MDGLTEQEKRVLSISADLYNSIAELKDNSSDMDEAVRDIHAIQNRIMARVAVRAHPELFGR